MRFGRLTPKDVMGLLLSVMGLMGLLRLLLAALGGFLF